MSGESCQERWGPWKSQLERFPDFGVKYGFIPERLILMGTWEKPLGWGFGIKQCPWWGGGGKGGRGHVTACHSLGAQEPRDLFLIHADVMYILTYSYPEDSTLACFYPIA